MIRPLSMALAALALCSPAFADATGQDSPAASAPAAASAPHRHQGLYFHGEFGLGYLNNASNWGGTYTGSGGTNLASLARAVAVTLGGAVREDLILGVQLLDGDTFGPGPGTSSESIQLLAFGPHVRWYSRSNFFAAATAGLGRISAFYKEAGFSSDSAWGLAGRLCVGKEFWVADHAGLTLAAQVSLIRSNEPSYYRSDLTENTFTAGLAFGVTFN
jgi:hypothetical protein